MNSSRQNKKNAAQTRRGEAFIWMVTFNVFASFPQGCSGTVLDPNRQVGRWRLFPATRTPTIII
jgi:hypothetical protein